MFLSKQTFASSFYIQEFLQLITQFLLVTKSSWIKTQLEYVIFIAALTQNFCFLIQFFINFLLFKILLNILNVFHIFIDFK